MLCGWGELEQLRDMGSCVPAAATTMSWMELKSQLITKTVNGLIELITNSKDMTIHSVHLSNLLQGIANFM